MRTHSVSLAFLVALAGCTDPQPGTNPEGAPPSSVQARDIGVESTTLADDAAADLAELIASTFSGSSAGDYSDNGAVESNLTGGQRCVTAELDSGALVLTFAGCFKYEGTLRLTHSRGQTTLWFEDDFAVFGTDVDGQLSVTARPLIGEYGFDGEIEWGAHSMAIDLNLEVDDPTLLWGFVDLELDTDRGLITKRVDLGTEKAPLTYDGSCTCPVAGELSKAGSITLDEVVIDLDDLFPGAAGAGTYPPLSIPIDATTLEGDMAVEFVKACGDQVVTVTADDVDLVLTQSNVAGAIDSACTDGLLTTEQCDELVPAAKKLAAETTVEVPLSMVADALEPELQSHWDEVCDAL